MRRGGGEPTRRVLDDARALDEILRAERRGEARRACGRQDVVGSGDVVANHLGGVAAHEDRARMAHATQAGSAAASATTTISLGPATMSMPTSPNTRAFARAT